MFENMVQAKILKVTVSVSRLKLVRGNVRFSWNLYWHITEVPPSVSFVMFQLFKDKCAILDIELECAYPFGN